MGKAGSPALSSTATRRPASPASGGKKAVGSPRLEVEQRHAHPSKRPAARTARKLLAKIRSMPPGRQRGAEHQEAVRRFVRRARRQHLVDQVVEGDVGRVDQIVEVGIDEAAGQVGLGVDPARRRALAAIPAADEVEGSRHGLETPGDVYRHFRLARAQQHRGVATPAILVRARSAASRSAASL